jgi:hypothetical protein
MGDIAKFEYVCFAQFVKKHGSLPRFNDKNRSPKHSKRSRLGSMLES